MTQIPVRHDDREYVKLLGSNGPNRYKEIKDKELSTLPTGAFILTGMKTAKLGGGPSPDGFVMNGILMLGRIRIEGRVKNGLLVV